MSSVAQLLRKADELKSTISDPSTGQADAWVARQELQDIYQTVLVNDLEHALDKKVEQDLWNHAFKNQISAMQAQSKDKQVDQKNEVHASLSLFLETASGFYLQLIQELCNVFKLDLPFRRKASFYGALQDLVPTTTVIKTPKHSSCLYICQHCLVHLGDIARYRQQNEQAQTFYRHAANLVPCNGQPYNQLAIIEATKGNKLLVVFYYVRSICVKHPFPVAATNLDKFFVKLTRDRDISSLLEPVGKPSLTELLWLILQFNAMVHTLSNLSLARKVGERVVTTLPAYIAGTSVHLSSYKLIQVLTISLFNMWHLNSQLEPKNRKEKTKELIGRLETSKSIVFSFIVSLMDKIIHSTPKQEQRAKDYFTLPSIKLILEWLLSDRPALSDPLLSGSPMWPNLCKLLNNLQFHSTSKENPFDPNKYASIPLPEDYDLQGFLLLSESQSDLKFVSLQPGEELSGDQEVRLRCHRLVQLGKHLCEDFPSLNLISYQTLKSNKIQFSAPTAQVRLLQVAPDVDTSPSSAKRSSKHNVAIQAIIQRKTQTESDTEKTVSPQTILQKKSQQTVSGAQSSGDESPFMAAIKKKAQKPNSTGDRTQKQVTILHSETSGVQPTSVSTGTNPPTPQKDPRPMGHHSAIPLHFPQSPMVNEPSPQDRRSFSASVGSPPQSDCSQNPGHASGHPQRPQVSPMAVQNSSPSQQHRQLGMPHMPAPYPISRPPRPMVPPTFTSPPPQSLPRPLFNLPPPSMVPPQFIPNTGIRAQRPDVKTLNTGVPPPPSGTFPHAPGSELHSRHPLHMIMNPSSWMDESLNMSTPWMHERNTISRSAQEPRDGPALFPNLPGKDEFLVDEPELGRHQMAFMRQPTGDVRSEGSPFFSDQGDSANYSLFSQQTPWGVQLGMAGDNKSHNSSPFSSHSGSHRNTPIDSTSHPPTLDSGQMRSTPMSFGGFPTSEPQWPSHPAQSSRPEGAGMNTLLSGSIQTLWSSGPSPLERLLEQQKHQRQTDPH